MRPLQFWLPSVSPSLQDAAVQRDMHRAYQAWNGESRVWLLPEITQTHRWQERRYEHVLALRAEHDDALSVYHVNDAGLVWGPAAASVFPEHSVRGLLDQWLNIKAIPLDTVTQPMPVTWQVPQFTTAGVVYVPQTRWLIPSNVFPLVEVDCAHNRWRIWPPQDAPVSVSPEAEARQYYDTKYVYDPDGFPILAAEEGQARHVIPKFPAPFERFFPLVADFDVYWHQQWMVHVAAHSAQDLQGALRRALALAGGYIQEGEACWEDIHHWPAVGDDRLRGRITTIPRPIQPSVRIPVRRVWGAIGLFWALLLDQLESRRPYQPCKWCGRLLQGRKTQCYPEDDPRCYAKWRSTAKAQQRARHNAE